jgi:hypothetical protein
MSNKSSTTSARELPISAQTLQAIATPVLGMAMVAVPFLIQTVRSGYRAFQRLPQNALQFAYGTVFCFFGGTFPTLFAAALAAEHGGRAVVLQSLSDLADEALIIIEENRRDEAADANSDGKSDVKDLSPTDYLTRKTKLGACGPKSVILYLCFSTFVALCIPLSHAHGYFFALFFPISFRPRIAKSFGR